MQDPTVPTTIPVSTNETPIPVVQEQQPVKKSHRKLLFLLFLLLFLIIIAALALILLSRQRPEQNIVPIVTPSPTAEVTLTPVPSITIPTTPPSSTPIATPAPLSKKYSGESYGSDGRSLQFSVPANFTETNITPKLFAGRIEKRFTAPATSAEAITMIEYFNESNYSDSSSLVKTGDFTPNSGQSTGFAHYNYEVRQNSDGSYFVIYDDDYRLLKVYLDTTSFSLDVAVNRGVSVLKTMSIDQM